MAGKIISKKEKETVRKIGRTTTVAKRQTKSQVTKSKESEQISKGNGRKSQKEVARKQSNPKSSKEKSVKVKESKTTKENKEILNQILMLVVLNDVYEYENLLKFCKRKGQKYLDMVKKHRSYYKALCSDNKRNPLMRAKILHNYIGNENDKKLLEEKISKLEKKR